MMKEDFEEYSYKEFTCNTHTTGNLIKSKNVNIEGLTKISVEEEEQEGIKIVLKKDMYDNIKEIKFVCACGQSKSIVLDYNE